MSSLKAARADNFYHPPDWDPRRGSRAELAAARLGEPAWKAHPLRERAKKLGEGILVVRFEMPFDVRCSGCGNRIAKGVRFNAEKKCVGKYLSTKVWSFRMMCAAEDGTSRTDRTRNAHYIEVRTDPKAADYVVAEGAVRVGDLDKLPGAKVPSAEELGVEELADPKDRERRAADPFYGLEHAPAARRSVERARAERVSALEDARASAWLDDYGSSQLLRRKHRKARHSSFAQAAEEAAKGIRHPLLPEAPEDAAAAAAIRFGASKATPSRCLLGTCSEPPPHRRVQAAPLRRRLRREAGPAAARLHLRRAAGRRRGAREGGGAPRAPAAPSEGDGDLDAASGKARTNPASDSHRRRHPGGPSRRSHRGRAAGAAGPGGAGYVQRQ